MPKASKPPKTCLCTCILHCRSSSSGTGSWVSRSTRINHRRDEQRLKHNQRERVPIRSKTNVKPAPAATGGQITIEQIRGEFHWLSSWPVSSSTKPFVFLHHPTSNGPYVPVVGSLETDLNTGIYALQPGHRSNFAYLFAETRYYRMISILEQLEEYGRGPLIDVIKKEILYLDHLKGLEWSRQRASDFPEGGPIVVNTGKDCKLFYKTVSHLHGDFFFFFF